MFTPGGQIDRVNRAVFGGGKGGGGGQSYTPPAPTVLTDPVSGKSFVQNNDPYSAGYNPLAPSASDQLNQSIGLREADERKRSEDLATEKKVADQNKENTFRQGRATAYDNAMKNAMHKFELAGANPYQYLDSDIQPELQREFDSIADLDPNPSAAFTPEAGDTLISNILSGKRTKASGDLDKLFTPTYAETALPDNLTDQYRDTILNEQFDPLQAQLTNAYKRGTLDDIGYGGAESRLNQKRSAASANIGTLGSTILGANRSSLNDYIKGARSDVNNLSLANEFDPNVYTAGAQSKIGAATRDFGGQLRNAVGETKFADISELLNAGGAMQGPRNAGEGVAGGAAAGGGSALSPSAISEDELAKNKRGLGNTGAF
jgi:hypothetical protein